ncbi:DNA circulation [Vibrio phage 1.017.O._10N.286.55.C11]|nr:DNA circulation [Vibrio phage 1.017.O._10N.286.55.C11]AUR85457.1 DNA circulation [Vibrio phage 1.075.O._10N.286.55.B10]AUR87003.1 DNA circulation [Vibrio phage 1.093.O._10N.286.55.E10]AUR87076.1 DNA circulation [Vibrio phage 1.094.O._10N.286.55.E12]
MAWQDRLQTCTYTSPSGAEFTLAYEDVKRTLKKKTTVFEFVSSDDVYVQDNFVGAKSFPMVVYFSGEDHDLQANDFFEGLSEQGAGQLQHPIYGLLTVNATDSIEQVDRLKTGANQSAFTITFIETITDLYPSAQTNRKEASEAASENFDNTKAGEFAGGINLDSVAEEQSLIGEINDFVGEYEEALKPLVEGVADAERFLNDVSNSITNGIDTLIGTPLTLAFQCTQLVKTATNTGSLIGDKLDAYGDLLDSIISPDNTTTTPTYNNVGQNSVQTQDLFAASNVSAIADSITATDFDTREEALSAAESVQNSFFNYVEWKERNYTSVGIEDEGAGYEALLEQITTTVADVVNNAATLQRIRNVVIDRDMLVLDFAYQYFGTSDSDTVEKVILLNGLDNSDIFTLEKGKLMRFLVN